MVKQKVIRPIGVFGHAESKSGLYFWVKLRSQIFGNIRTCTNMLLMWWALKNLHRCSNDYDSVLRDRKIIILACCTE